MLRHSHVDFQLSAQVPPSLMNQLDSISEREVTKDALLLGLSPLHARIKCMECFLHIASRLTLQTWAVNRSKRETFDRRKKGIQTSSRRRLGLWADMVKQGMGSSNDGNTARRFFSDAQLTEEIAGLDQILLHRMLHRHYILCHLSRQSARIRFEHRRPRGVGQNTFRLNIFRTYESKELSKKSGKEKYRAIEDIAEEYAKIVEALEDIRLWDRLLKRIG